MDDIRPGQTFNPGGQGTSIPINSAGGDPPPSASQPAEAPAPVAPEPPPTPPVPEVPEVSTAPEVPAAPAVPSAPVSPMPPSPTGRRNFAGIGKIMPWAAGIVLAAIVGGGVYYWQAQQFSALRTESQSEKDVLKSQVNALQEQVKALSKPEAKAAQDEDQIKERLAIECQADGTKKAGAVTDVKITGTFATADIVCGTKNHAILKKVSDHWVMVYLGLSTPTTIIRSKYQIPASIR